MQAMPNSRHAAKLNVASWRARRFARDSYATPAITIATTDTVQKRQDDDDDDDHNRTSSGSAPSSTPSDDTTVVIATAEPAKTSKIGAIETFPAVTTGSASSSSASKTASSTSTATPTSRATTTTASVLGASSTLAVSLQATAATFSTVTSPLLSSTTAVPSQALLSAPSESITSAKSQSNGLNPGQIAGIAVGVTAFVTLLLALLIFCYKRRHRTHNDQTSITSIPNSARHRRLGSSGKSPMSDRDDAEKFTGLEWSAEKSFAPPSVDMPRRNGGFPSMNPLALNPPDVAETIAAIRRSLARVSRFSGLSGISGRSGGSRAASRAESRPGSAAFQSASGRITPAGGPS